MIRYADGDRPIPRLTDDIYLDPLLLSPLVPYGVVQYVLEYMTDQRFRGEQHILTRRIELDTDVFFRELLENTIDTILKNIIQTERFWLYRLLGPRRQQPHRTKQTQGPLNISPY